MRCTRWSPGIPIWRPDSAHSSTSRCRSSRLIPCTPWRYVDLTVGDLDLDEQIQRVCAAERAAVCDLADQPAFRAALIRTAEDRHRFVLTNHHIVLDGWSLPILLREMFASYYGQRLPAAAPYRRFIDAGWPTGIAMPPARPGVRCSPVSTPPPWWARRTG